MNYKTIHIELRNLEKVLNEYSDQGWYYHSMEGVNTLVLQDSPTGTPSASGSLPTDTKTNTDVTLAKDLGVLSSGVTIPSGTSLQQFVELVSTTIFFPTFTEPSVNLTSNVGTTVEAGTNVFRLTCLFDDGEITGEMNGPVWDANKKQAERSGSPTKYTIEGVDGGLTNFRNMTTTINDGNNVFSCRVDHASGPQPHNSEGAPFSSPLPVGYVTDTVTIRGRRKLFYGIDSLGNDSSTIRALSNDSLNPSNGTSFTINVPVGSTSVVFAYPSTLQSVSSVKYVEGLNAEIKDVFTQTTVQVEGSNGYTSTAYRVYRYQPVSSFSQNSTYNIII
jgi:hypothetical protein